MAPVGLVVLWPHAPGIGIAMVLLSHALVLYPVLQPNCQWLGPVVTRFETARREVWLTIDDGPAADTPAVLELLDRHRVRATFFVKGILAASRPELVREIIARGHTVANHSHTHPERVFWCALPSRIASEIDLCNDVLGEATGERPAWFRAPVGHKNPAVHPALARRGMRLIGWSARGLDAVLKDPGAVLSRILPDLAPGAIVLLHQGRPHSLRVLEHTIAAIRERGYECVVPEDTQLRSADDGPQMTRMVSDDAEATVRR